ncbi:PRTase-like protein [Periconia macrospinosa]|uniref:adenine phosphoribosyltransferase n=1 Tax=Periconia macrospinosa TaxID=97972 RepID=A0A2V1CX35_9PLEO|nr:PRTase-like protein [Periconia macrospinosa]
MVHSIPDFPRTGAHFRHVLGISQQPGGLALCTSLLHSHFTGDWAKINAVVCCEVGGLVYAPALALRIGAGKLPGPTVSAMKPSSYISSLASGTGTGTGKEKRIEMERHAIPQDASVVIMDNVMSTGETLCAMLQLLRGAGVDPGHVNVMVVAEFPIHRGRHLLRQRGDCCRDESDCERSFSDIEDFDDGFNDTDYDDGEYDMDNDSDF